VESKAQSRARYRILLRQALADGELVTDRQIDELRRAADEAEADLVDDLAQRWERREGDGGGVVISEERAFPQDWACDDE